MSAERPPAEPRRRPPLAGPRLVLALASLGGGVIAMGVGIAGTGARGEVIGGVVLIIAGVIHLVILAIQGGLS